MPVFEYKGLNKSRKKIKGSIDADSAKQARSKLKNQGIYVTDLKEGGLKSKSFDSQNVLELFKSNSLSQKELAALTRQLATLVNAGLPIIDSLKSCIEQTESETMRRIIVSVRESVEEGSSLSQALEKYPKAFPRLFVSMVASGEASGTLDTVLLNLAEHLETQSELLSKIKSAMMYPVLMLAISFVVIMLLFIFLVPKIVVIFTKQGAVLPMPTKITMAISNFLVVYWWLLIILAIAGFFLFVWFRSLPLGRAKMDTLLLRIPIFAPLYQKIYSARVAQTLGTLLNSGVQLLTALDISKRVVANVHVVKAIEEASSGVREGKSLATELKKSNLFPSMLIQMIAIGEKSGEVEDMLIKAGVAYKSEANNTLSGLTRVLELLMIIVVGCIVLWVVLSVLLPMVGLVDLIQK